MRKLGHRNNMLSCPASIAGSNRAPIPTEAIRLQFLLLPKMPFYPSVQLCISPCSICKFVSSLSGREVHTKSSNPFTTNSVSSIYAKHLPQLMTWLGLQLTSHWTLGLGNCWPSQQTEAPPDALSSWVSGKGQRSPPDRSKQMTLRGRAWFRKV